MAKFFNCSDGSFVNCELVTWAGVYRSDPCAVEFSYQGEDEYRLQEFDTPEDAKVELYRFIEFAHA